MHRFHLIAPLCALMMFLAGCGDSGPSQGGDDVVPTGEVVVIQLSSNDQMEYDQDQFTVQAGQTVRLILEHTGTLPVEAMGHNVVILKKGESYESFGSEAATKGGNVENSYVPDAMLNRVIAHTELIGGGETTQIEFVAPAPGEYPYLCSFPGHFVMMHGKMIVK